MTHLNRIFIQKASVPVSSSAILPVSSVIFASFYNSMVCGRSILSGDGVSKPGIIRTLKRKSSINKFQESPNKFGKGADFYEKINPKYLEKIRFMTGVSISPYCLGWAVIDLVEKSLVTFGGQVLASQSEEFAKSQLGIYNIACDVKKKIPESDLYIMEDHRYYKMRSLSEIEIQLLSMLIVLLNSGCESTESKVILQKRSVIDFMFELRIGGERVSAHQKVQRMLNNLKCEQIAIGEDEDFFDFPFISNLKLSNNFLRLIYDSKPPLNDACSVALLLVLSFIEINLSQIKSKVTAK